MTRFENGTTAIRAARLIVHDRSERTGRLLGDEERALVDELRQTFDARDLKPPEPAGAPADPSAGPDELSPGDRDEGAQEGFAGSVPYNEFPEGF